MAKKKKLVTGLDIGTTKVCAVIAEIDEGDIHLLGVGRAPCHGLRKGNLVNLTETIEATHLSLQAAQEMAQREVSSAFVSIGGPLLSGLNRSGRTEIKGRHNEVTADDINRAVENAQEKQIPEDYRIVHVLTQNFRIDSQEGIENPLGLFGQQLTVNLHLVITATSAIQNLLNAANRSGLVVEALVMQSLASSQSVLTPDEKTMGSFLVDIGGGTTDLAVYSRGSIYHSEVLPLGADLITKDIAIALKVPVEDAEHLKIISGSPFPDSIPEEEALEIVEMGTGQHKMISRQHLCHIVRARADEILRAVAQSIQRVGLNSRLVSGVVLTGGGALLEGLVERAEEVLKLPVRLGYPANVTGSRGPGFDPAFSTALGLLRYAISKEDRVVQELSKRSSRARQETGISWWINRLLEWMT